MSCAETVCFVVVRMGGRYAEAGSALPSPFPLLITAGRSLSTDPSGIIESPSPHDEPPGYVTAEEQNRGYTQICLCCADKLQ